ncbi:MAG: hypothetical protein OWU84_05785 [Firmicutes bacterium]|nr:hypothetical protein [Bacillota bacterium]
MSHFSWNHWHTALQAAPPEVQGPLDRLGRETEYLRQLLIAHGQERQWSDVAALVAPAVQALAQGALDRAAAQVPAIEAQLHPWQALAKSLTVFYVGHAHMDMNWLWDWPETVTMVLNTLTTVTRLMDRFPHFHFSQSQTAVYDIVRRYDPALFARIGERVREGRWEITANQWVEGDKNLAAAEALVRHILYSKAFFQEHWGIPWDQVQVAFEPDTFGHPAWLPTLYREAGIRWLYYCRGGPGHPVFRWQAADGADVLAWSDYQEWYNGAITGDEVFHAVQHWRDTGLPLFLKVYGVGDHGGGPTARDLERLAEMAAWPLFPTLRPATLADFFRALEASRDQLPVHRGELNFVFPGCYTSQSDIKTANAKNEAQLGAAEALLALAQWAGGAVPAPRGVAQQGWTATLFNQFHDILSGSGVPETYRYAYGRAQEATAAARVLTQQAMAALSDAIDFGAGPADHVPLVIANPLAWERTDLVELDVYERFPEGTALHLLDEAGQPVAVQYFYDRYFGFPGHQRVHVVFPATVPGLGYRVYWLGPGPNVGSAHPLTGQALAFGHQALSLNGAELAELGLSSRLTSWPVEALPRHFRLFFQSGVSSYQHGLQIDTAWYQLRVSPGQSGAEIVDRATGRRWTGVGELLSFVEEPHGMSAWEIAPDQEGGPVPGMRWTVEEVGPVRFVLKGEAAVRASRVTVRLLCAADQPDIVWRLTLDWRDLGSPAAGVPGLRIRFPWAARGDTSVPQEARFGQALGSIRRPLPSRDVPAQRWTAGHAGHSTTYVLHPTRYGVSVDETGIAVTLLRASYDPDPYAEVGSHAVTLAYGWQPAVLSGDALTRRALERLTPLLGWVADPARSARRLPPRGGALALTSEAGVVTAVKPAEDGSGVVARLTQDTAETQAVSLALGPAADTAEAVTLLERPTPATLQQEGTQLTVSVPPRGLKSIKITGRASH